MLKGVLSCGLSLLLLSSCEKTQTNLAPEASVNQATDSLKSVLAFQSYGLNDNGIADNTAALQKLVNESSEIYLKGGTYIINQTINLKSGLKIYGEPTTVIKAGNQMSGTLSSNGRYFFAGSTDQIVISGITFKQSDMAYQWSDWNNSCIYLLNCKNTLIEGIFFDFKLPYATNGMEAVWISGTGSTNNTIKNNNINTLGIKYAENGADGTIVHSNILNNAYSNAITANGNHPSDYITNCQIVNNTIKNAGRMGIEDWGNTNGALIKWNKVYGSGKDPNQAIDGIAISAVGSNVSVIGNHISDSQIYAIEVRGNYGVTVTHNTMTNNPASTGIILNYTFPIPQFVSGVTRAMVGYNKIEKSDIGIHIFGDYEANVKILRNTLNNSITKAISIESGSPSYLLDLEGNRTNYTIPASRERYALFSYTKFDPGAANQVINSTADSLIYAPSASGGAGTDFGMVIRTDQTTISKLVVRGDNNRSASGSAIQALTAHGGKPIGLRLLNNHVLGARVDLSGFSSPYTTGNNF